VRHLSLRGKNLLFVDRMAGALQLDAIAPDTDFGSVKRAFTPAVVRKIHEAILELWPDSDDYVRCLSGQRNEVTALYTGTYEPEAIFRALLRHCLYSERILLPDPFMHPLHVRDQFNPLLHPEEHRSETVKWFFLWITLLPWIEHGLVSFVRTPGDFDPGEYHEILEVQRDKFASSPELTQAMDRFSRETVQDMRALDRGLVEYCWLSRDDDELLKLFHVLPANPAWKDAAHFLSWVRYRRETHPYFVEPLPGQKEEFLHETTGACYEAAKRICAITQSHIITDLHVRWKEIEFDHEHATGKTAIWSPFAKALQNAHLKVLSDVTIQAAFALRREQRLEKMRHFFNRVWRACREPAPYAEANAANLAAELDHRVREAEAEWENIDKELLKWFGATGGTLLSSGIVGFVPAAAAAIATGVAGLVRSQWQRKSFKRRFPAALFLTPRG